MLFRKQSPSSPVDAVADAAARQFERAGERASALTQRGIEAVRDHSQQLRDRTARASDHTVRYIRHEPVKSVLVAAAAGAVLVALLGLLRRPG